MAARRAPLAQRFGGRYAKKPKPLPGLGSFAVSLPPVPRTDVTVAVLTLNDYLQGAVTLDELIEWAEHLERKAIDDIWLQRVTRDLANPLLCREQATALVLEHLRAKAALDG